MKNSIIITTHLRCSGKSVCKMFTQGRRYQASRYFHSNDPKVNSRFINVMDNFGHIRSLLRENCPMFFPYEARQVEFVWEFSTDDAVVIKDCPDVPHKYRNKRAVIKDVSVGRKENRDYFRLYALHFGIPRLDPIMLPEWFVEPPDLYDYQEG